MGIISKIPNVHSYDETNISFYNLDVHLSKIDFNEINSFDDLLNYIKEPIENDDDNRNIYLARAIVKLMYLVRGECFVTKLPLDVEYELCTKDMADSFHDICRRLDIPCQVIKGYMKDFTSYRHEHYFQQWCAFKAHGRWHLVDLVGILTSTSYRDNEGMILLESEGETVFDKLEQNMGFSSITFNDFWFCTKPQIFAYFNFPTNQDWLILGESKGPKTLEEFESMPFTYLDYHILGLQFLSETSSILHSKNGRCSISLMANPLVMRSKCFSYTLSFLEGTGDISGLKKDDLPLLVRYAPGIDTFSFNIRFPISGHYVFDVVAKDIDEGHSIGQCFDFVIICDEADPQCRKLPIDAGIVGYGFGHTARDAGLKNPSKTNPTMNVNIQTETDALPSVLTFQIEDDQIDAIDYGSKLVGAESGDWLTETHLDSEKGKLTVVAGVKTEGEYALSITARTRDSADAPKTILNYLLTTEENEDDEKQAKMMKQKKMDMILESKMEERISIKTDLTKKIDVVLKELRELRKLQIEDEDISREEDHNVKSSLCTDDSDVFKDEPGRSSIWIDEPFEIKDDSGICKEEPGRVSICYDELFEIKEDASVCKDESIRTSVCIDEPYEIKGDSGICKNEPGRSSICTDEPFEIKDDFDVCKDEPRRSTVRIDEHFEIKGDFGIGKDEPGKSFICTDEPFEINNDPGVCKEPGRISICKDVPFEIKDDSGVHKHESGKSSINIDEPFQIKDDYGVCEDEHGRSSICIDEPFEPKGDFGKGKDEPGRSTICTDEPFEMKDDSDVCKDEPGRISIRKDEPLIIKDDFRVYKDEPGRSSICIDEVLEIKDNSGVCKDEPGRISICKDEPSDIKDDFGVCKDKSICFDEPFEIKDNNVVCQDKSGKTIENDAKTDAYNDEMTNVKITDVEVRGKLKELTSKEESESKKTKICKLL